MNVLEQKIQNEAVVLPGEILKVDNFLNHQIDTEIMDWIGEEFYRRFKEDQPTKILTLEASGIAPAYATARSFHLPVIFAKKSRSHNLGDQQIYVATVRSYTYGNDYKITVAGKYISSDDRILIIDDFLANGKAAEGLMEVCRQAGAHVVGVGVCVEKGFQPGGKTLREKGIHLESLAIIDSMGADGIRFREQ